MVFKHFKCDKFLCNVRHWWDIWISVGVVIVSTLERFSSNYLFGYNLDIKHHRKSLQIIGTTCPQVAILMSVGPAKITNSSHIIEAEDGGQGRRDTDGEAS